MGGRLVMILGPTAVGKTAVAMALQDLLGGRQSARLISVDSALVYRGMDIGTAKPSRDELTSYPHDLVDIRDPVQPYSAAEFVQDADTAVQNAWRRGQLPVLVGGTMLYAKRFIEGIAQLPDDDPEMRAALQAELASRGGQALHAELAAIDPLAAANIHPNNPQRLLRALQVVRTTKQPISRLWREQAGPNAVERLGAEIHAFGLQPSDRGALHERIARRFEQMLAAGFLAEAKLLFARPDLNPDLPSMRLVGYRQAWQYLAGEIGADSFAADAVTATRRLAKRQLTWLRQWPQLHYLQCELAGTDTHEETHEKTHEGTHEKTAEKALRMADEIRRRVGGALH